MKYSDMDAWKTAFIFELDDVLYPEKDYLFQVYYLFAALLEYVEHTDAKAATDLMVKTYLEGGRDKVFNAVKEQFQLKESYLANFEHLLVTANVPLKLLLYKNMLDLLQEIVVDRKKLFIVTNGDPAQQLNKIKHTDWNGLEQYLICYFANETSPKPEPDVIHLLLKEHNLLRRDLVMIGNSKTDELCAQAIGVDYMNTMQFL
jgi:phosphoglycolate phosphatase-like HAD superfamily hydrolase